METGMCICTVNNNVVYFLQKHVYEQLRNHFFKATISSSLLFKVASSLVRAHWGMTLTAVCCFQFKKRYWFCKLPCIRLQVELSSTFVYDSKMSTGGISARNSHLSQGGRMTLESPQIHQIDPLFPSYPGARRQKKWEPTWVQSKLTRKQISPVTYTYHHVICICCG